MFLIFPSSFLRLNLKVDSGNAMKRYPFNPTQYIFPISQITNWCDYFTYLGSQHRTEKKKEIRYVTLKIFKYFFSTPSPAFIARRLLDSSHPDWRVMVPHCGLDLHFSDNEWCWASFHMFFSHLYSLQLIKKIKFKKIFKKYLNTKSSLDFFFKCLCLSPFET